MKAIIRKEIEITPYQMGKKLVDGEFRGLCEEEIINILVNEFKMEKDEAEIALFQLSYKEFIEILEKAVSILKENLT